MCFVNPRRTCARVTVVVLSVCLLSHISLQERLFVLKTLSRTQRATKVEKFVAFSMTADNTHAHCAYASSPRFAMDAPCPKLSLRSSFMMMESSKYCINHAQ